MSSSNYFYGGQQTEQFSFFRIPRALMRDERFKDISTDAKLLYGLMLDRMGLSMQHGWFDEQNRVFIYFTLQEVQETLSCGHNKGVGLMAELEQYGLIERIKHGLGRPAIIYVKNFVSADIPNDPPSPTPTEDEKADLQKSEKPTSRLPFSKLQDFPKGECNYTKKNYTDFSDPDLSINPIYPKHLLPTSRPQGIEPPCPQVTSTGDNAAVGDVVPASMSFVKHKRPLVRGKPLIPLPGNASHRKTHFSYPGGDTA